MKCLWIILFVFSFSVFAAPNSPLYFSVAVKGGLGNGGSYDDEAMESRELYVFGGEATLGFFVYSVMIGGSAEYSIWKQKTDPDDVNDSDISGKQTTLSPVIGFPIGPCLLQLKFPVYSTYTLDKKSEGKEQEYSDAMILFSFMLAYSLGNTFIGVEYTKLEYKKLSEDGDETTLARDDRLTLSLIGLVYGYKF